MPPLDKNGTLEISNCLLFVLCHRSRRSCKPRQQIRYAVLVWSWVCLFFTETEYGCRNHYFNISKLIAFETQRSKMSVEMGEYFLPPTFLLSKNFKLLDSTRSTTTKTSKPCCCCRTKTLQRTPIVVLVVGLVNGL